MIKIDFTLACPNCAMHNHDKQYSSEGPIDELQCHNCFKMFKLSEEKEDGTTCR